MKRVLVLITAAALIAPIAAWRFIDGPTAIFFLIASVLVCICAAMPVVFSVVTRRSRARPHDASDVETIDMDKEEGT